MQYKDYLKSLGNTSDEIAESLRKQNIKGKVRCPSKCIIMNALVVNCGRNWAGLEIRGGTYKGKACYSATWNDCQTLDPQLPQPIQDFIAAFDDGKYPDLVTTKVRDVVTVTRVWE